MGLTGAEGGCTICCPAARPGRSFRFSATVLPVTVRQSPSQHSFRQEHLHHRWNSAGVMQVLHHILAARLEVGDNRGTRSLTFWKSSMDSGTFTDRAMARRCSTALVDPPSTDDDHHGVFESFAGHDVARFDVQFRAGFGWPRRRAGTRPASAGLRRGSRNCRAGTSPAPRWPRPSCWPYTCRRRRRRRDRSGGRSPAAGDRRSCRPGTRHSSERRRRCRASRPPLRTGTMVPP